MKNYILEFKFTGECPINVAAVINQWNNRCSIKQYHEEYTLMEDAWRAGKRKHSSKIRISKTQAHELIGQLNLLDERSDLVRNGRIWRTCASENEMVTLEIQSYFKKRPNSKPSKFVKNVIDSLGINI